MASSINGSPSSKRSADTPLNPSHFTLNPLKRRKREITDDAVSAAAQTALATAAPLAPASLPAAFPMPEDVYRKAHGEITSPQFDPDTYETYKQITVGDKTYRSLKGSIGSGDSFMAFKCIELNSSPERTVVIKVFHFGLFSTKRRPAQTLTLAKLNERIALLKSNYDTALELGIPSAEIYNLAALTSDGCILQECLIPIGSSVPWANKTELLEKEKLELETFCDILEKAIQTADRKSWDLLPKNFGWDLENALKLFDFSDQSLVDQWAHFHQAVKKWIGSNQAAKELVLAKLEAMKEKPALSAEKDSIIARYNKINEPL